MITYLFLFLRHPVDGLDTFQESCLVPPLMANSGDLQRLTGQAGVLLSVLSDILSASGCALWKDELCVLCFRLFSGC